MKRPEYVAAAVHAYRQALDGQPVEEEEIERLKTVFSRGGLTAGYYEGRRGRAMFGRRTGEDSRAAKETYAPLHALYRTERQSVEVDLTLQRDQTMLWLCAADREGRQGRAGMQEQPDLPPLESGRLQRQLQKSGGTPFRVVSVSCPDEPVRARLAAINDLRRRALESLLDQRAAGTRVPLDREAYHSFAAENHPGKPAHGPAGSTAALPRPGVPLWARFGRPEQLPTGLEQLGGLERFFLPLEWDDAFFVSLLSNGMEVGMDLPRGMFGCEEAVTRRMEELRALGVKIALAHNLASVRTAAALGLTVCGGEGCNVTNSNTLLCLRRMGAASLTLSPELTLSEAGEIGDGGLLLYGRLPLMLTRNCPAANGGGCGRCQDGGQSPPVITDRKNIAFPLVCRYGCTEVLNSRPLWMADRMREVGFASFGMLWFTIETGEETQRVLAAYREGAPSQGEYTRGLYYRGSDQTRAAASRHTPGQA